MEKDYYNLFLEIFSELGKKERKERKELYKPI
jgi:hypothetical protein